MLFRSTLVEDYQFDSLNVFHFDFYRLHSAQELMQIGLIDYLTADAICLIEWPENAGKLLPEATLYCTIEIPENGQGRLLSITSRLKEPNAMLKQLDQYRYKSS